MTLLTVCEALAKNVGLPVPAQVAAATDRTSVEMLQFANDTATEIARRVDWGRLTASATITGTGAAVAHSLPSGFSRIAAGASVFTSGGAVIRSLTRAEWDTLTAVQGTPRYFYVTATTIQFWPYLANAATARLVYQTGNWCSNGTSAFSADSNTALFSEVVLEKGLIARWRRQKGMDFADFEAEYEAELKNQAAFDDRSRF